MILFGLARSFFLGRVEAVTLGVILLSLCIALLVDDVRRSTGLSRWNYRANRIDAGDGIRLRASSFSASIRSRTHLDGLSRHEKE